MKAFALALILVPALCAAAAPTPELAVSALWRAISHDPGMAGDAAGLQALLHPDATVYGSRYRDGAAALSLTRGADFVAAIGRPAAKGFYECEVAREVRQYDRFATVYSVVESRRERGAAKADFTGVNSIQLFRDDAGWRIVSLYYQVEKPGLPIPLDNARPGACLEGA